MANETGYKSNKVLFFRETTEGITPSTIAIAYLLNPMAMSFDRIQRTETNTLLGNDGQPSKTDTGGEDPAGSMDLKRTPDWDIILSQAVLGAYTTKTTLNDVHAVSTAYAVDDVTVLAGTDVLVCVTAGTSETTDTQLLLDVAAASTGDTITDGTVEWVVTKGKTAMYQYDGVLNDNLIYTGMLFLDTTAQAGGVAHNTIGRGVRISNMTIGKEQGGVIAKTSHNIMAHGALSDTQAGVTVPTVTSEVALEDNPFKRDEICVTVDGVAPNQVSTVSLSIERNITIEDGVKCFTVAGVQVSEKITDLGTPTISGTMSARFSVERFKQAFENAEQSLVITYRKRTGQFSQFTMPKTQLLDSTKTYDPAKPVILDIPLNAYGTNLVKGLSYSIRGFLDYTA